MTNLNIRALRASLFGALVMAALLFLPAGTLNYWQAWVFLSVFVGASSAITVDLAIKDPALLERRLKVGPKAETEQTQKFAVTLAIAGFVALLVVPALDHRVGWSHVPPWISLAGDALIVFSFVFMFLVLRENPFGASTIQVVKDQTVISTGPYGVVRHPMYGAALVMVVGTSLALGSWWGLLPAVLMFPALIWRLRDEEAFLTRNLPGYAEYAQRVRYRLVPLVW
jgi:protein-S-isoprenylcysteine O-methyltransferase Ste14